MPCSFSYRAAVSAQSTVPAIQSTVSAMVNHYQICSDLTTSDFQSLSLTRGIAGIVCAIACIITLVGILATKAYKSLNQRLFLYLTISTVAFLISLALQLVNEIISSQDGTFCSVVGGLRQWTGFLQLLITLGIILYLLLFVTTTLQKLPCLPCNKLSVRFNELSLRRRVCLELCALILVLLISTLVSVVPLFAGSPYGEMGPWCWIQSLENNKRNCTHSSSALFEEMGMWFVPFAAVSLLSFVLFMVTFAAILYGICKGGVARSKVKTILLRCALTFSFLIAYFILCCILTAANVLATKYDHDVYWVWLLYALFTPVSSAIIPIVFWVHKVYTTYCNKPHTRRIELICSATQHATYAPPSIEDSIPSETDACVLTSSHSVQPSDTIQSSEAEPLLSHANPNRCNIM